MLYIGVFFLLFGCSSSGDADTVMRTLMNLSTWQFLIVYIRATSFFYMNGICHRPRLCCYGQLWGFISHFFRIRQELRFIFVGFLQLFGVLQHFLLRIDSSAFQTQGQNCQLLFFWFLPPMGLWRLTIIRLVFCCFCLPVSSVFHLILNAEFSFSVPVCSLLEQ